MSILTKKRVRIKLDQDLGIPFSISNVLTGDSAETWQANATDIEIAVFNTDTIASVSDLTSINCKIQPSQIKELILADSTVASGSLDDTTTAATWTDGTQQHALFSFTNAEMNLAVPGSVQEFWLVFTGLTTAGSEVTLGAGKFFIHQDNNEAGDPPATNLGTAITIEEADARYETIGGAAGDMEASTYDPTTVAGDAFAMDNMVEGTAKILTSAERTTIGTVAPHIADTANPHAVTKAQVGLSNVDDTADADKPISTATQAGLAGKQDILTVSDTAPVSPDAGDLWLDSTQTKLYTYYNDGNSSQWVSVNSGSSTTGLYDKLVVVNQSNVATTLGGVIDSTKVYFIDGIIDLGATQITVPPTGMTIKGHSFDISGLTSSEDNYTMFISESIAIGSGNLLGADYFIQVDGAGSKVYELYDATGFNAFEFARINYNDCTSLGDLYDYRQGLEEGTGRFGGSPSLTLHGLWRGGYRITTSIVRSLAGTMTAPLFKGGTAFQMDSRFLTDINCDLPTLAPFCDFSTSSFPNPSTIQFKGGIFSRDGAFNANDSNITPNLSPSDLPCDWDNNIGIGNTFVGGILDCTAESTTNIVTAGDAVDLAGTFTASDLQHFDSPANGRLRHTGINPKEFVINFDLVIDGTQNAEVEIFLIKIDSLAAVTVEFAQTRVINNLQGGRDVAYFTGQNTVRLNQNDLVFWQVANVNGTGDVTLEQSSSWAVRER